MFGRKIIKTIGISLISLLIATISFAGEIKSKTEKGAVETFKFGVISDIHYGHTPPVGTADANFKQAMNGCVQGNCDFVLITGDIVESSGTASQFDSFDAAITAMGIPSSYWLPIPGNHDISDPPTTSKIDAWIARGYGRGTNNRDYYGFTYKNAAIFCMNTLTYRSTDPTVLQRAADQITEMTSFFAANQSMPMKIIVGHVPLFTVSSDEGNTSDGSTSSQHFRIFTPYRNDIINVMDTYNVNYFVCGHRHYDYTQPDAKVGGHITVFDNTTTNFPLGSGTQGYNVYTVTDSNLTRTHYDLSQVPPTSTPTPTPAPTGGTVISCDLGNTNIDNHISQVLNENDGNTTADTSYGREHRYNTDPAAAAGQADYYFYFRVDDAVSYQGNHPTCDVIIDYYDSTNAAQIKLQYDSPGTVLADHYKNSTTTITTGGTDTWKTGTFHLTDAYFGNGENGACDLRVFVGAKQVRIDKISIHIGNPTPTPTPSPTIVPTPTPWPSLSPCGSSGTASGTVTPCVTIPPPPSTTSSPSPTATPSPTTNSSATPSPTATVNPTVTPTQSPIPSSTPSPTASPTSTVSPTPTVTPTPTPTALPVASYDFEVSDQEWTNGYVVDTFTSPTCTYTSGTLTLQAKDDNTFGYWRSPLDAIDYIPNSIYKTTFAVKGSAPQDKAPTMRVHMDTQSSTVFGILVVESWLDASESPSAEPKNYSVYFDPMNQTNYQSGQYKELMDDLFVGIDILSFSNEDDVNGAFSLDGVLVERFDKDTMTTGTTVKVYDTTQDFDNWTSGVISKFTPPLFAKGDGSLSLISDNNTTNTYGYWESSRLDNEIDIQPNKLYRARFTVLSTTPQSNVPQMRLRLGTESNKETSAYIVFSNMDGINSPTTTPKTYDVYLYPPQSDINQNSYINGLIVSMDMLNFDYSPVPNDDPNGDLILDKVEVQAIDINKIP